MIKFSQIPDKLKYPPAVKGKLSTYHSTIVEYATLHFKKTSKCKRSITSALNTISYIVMSGDSLPETWSPESPLEISCPVDDDTCREFLKDLYLIDKSIDWDISESIPANIPSFSQTQTSSKAEVKPQSDHKYQKAPSPKVTPTPKSDLYIQPPVIPQFDFTKPWKSKDIQGVSYVIYSSLPEIPIRQNEISCTTDESKFAYVDLMKLFPNRTIQTRSSIMYQPCEGITLDEDVGLLIPILNFSEAQIKDNIIKYPHIYKLQRALNDDLVSFYAHIEIDGELKPVSEIWDDLQDSVKIPKTSEFVKEYVVRRYLLERDVLGIKHVYPLFGSLDPFLTLFTTSDEYIRWGYQNVEDIARQCVRSRIRYKQSRNPVLRRMNNV